MTSIDISTLDTINGGYNRRLAHARGVTYAEAAAPYGMAVGAGAGTVIGAIVGNVPGAFFGAFTGQAVVGGLAAGGAYVAGYAKGAFDTRKK